MKRVVITGIGVIAPTGIGKNLFWKGISSGESFIETITTFDISTLPSKIAAEAKDFNPLNYLSTKDIKRMDRSTHMAIAATKEAIIDSNLDINTINNQRIGVIVGSSLGGIGYAEKEIKKLYSEDLKKMSPYTTTGTFCGG